MPTLKLSDNSTIDVPDNTPDSVAADAVRQGEDAIAQTYQQHAADTGAPVTAGDKIYSATRAYPNSYLGGAMAWLDHNAGGNWMNRKIADPLNAATGDAGPTAMRMGTNALAGSYDLGASVYDVGKHYVAPSLGTAYDAPLVGQTIRSQIGAPELPAGASFLRRVLEGGASGAMGGGLASALSPSSYAKNIAGATVGTAGSEVGGQVGGEMGSLLGSLAGGVPYGKFAAKGVAPLVAHENAPAIYQAGQELGFVPSYRTLANTTGQRFGQAVGSLPIVGAPLEAANEATRSAIMQARDTAAGQISGTPLPPGGASPETIGSELVPGTQQAITNIKARQAAQWEPIHQAMEGQTVDVAPVVAATNRMLDANRTTPGNQGAVSSVASELASMAPGGANYSAARGPVPPLPQPTMEVPWSAVKDFRSGLKYQLGTGDLRVPDNLIADVKDATTAAMQRAAQGAGVGNQFDVASRNYAEMRPTLKTLQGVGGTPLGTTGDFQGAKPEGTAFTSVLGRNLQNPSAIEPFVNNMPSDYWRRAAGQFVSTLGNSKQGDFRPEHFYDQWKGISAPVQTQLVQSASGRPLDALHQLNNAATVAQNFSTPTSRHGLMSSLGAGAATGAVLGHAGMLGSTLLGGVGGALAPAAAAYGIARGLEAPTMKRAMASQPLGIANSIYSAMPRLGAISNQEYYDRLRMSPAAGGPR